MQDLKSMKLVELQELAREKGIKNVRAMRKQELIDMISGAQAETDQKAETRKETIVQESQQAELPKDSSQEKKETDYRTGRAQSPEGRSYDNRNSDNRQSQTRIITNRNNSGQPRNSGYQNNQMNQNRTGNGNYSNNRGYNNSQTRSYNSNSQGQTRTFTPNPARTGNNRSSMYQDNSSQASQGGYNRYENQSRYENSQRQDNSGRYENQRYDNSRYDNPRNDNDRNDAYTSDERTNEYQRNDYRRRMDMQDPNAPDFSNGRSNHKVLSDEDYRQLNSGEIADGILEIIEDNGYGFIRSDNFESGDNDVYVSQSQIRRFNMKTGDRVSGPIRIMQNYEKFPALLQISAINGYSPEDAVNRKKFESLTPIFPNKRLQLEGKNASNAMRIMNLFSPVGKGQRGMIVSPPKAGKTTMLKEIASAVIENHPEVHIIILLIDERPEEVTDIRETIEARSDNVEVISSTFDEKAEHHCKVSEMVLEHAKRLVEHGQDVMILLDSITRLTRAYNQTVNPSGRTLSGGLDPAALHLPKRFFGAARNMREGGSLTILATALVDTGSRMDDVVFEEFKGTGNMEIVLDRKLSEKRVFPAIDLLKSGTRRDDLLLSRQEQEGLEHIRRFMNSMKPEDAVERLIAAIHATENNKAMLDQIRVTKGIPNYTAK